MTQIEDLEREYDSLSAVIPEKEKEYVSSSLSREAAMGTIYKRPSTMAIGRKLSSVAARRLST